jgi:MoaA/NifB/PqqE/SkfB family radical SAM enzyme
MPVANFINKIRERNGSVFLEILGGEPTLWPKLPQFIDAVLHDDLVIELNTNGSRTLRFWEDFPAGNHIINFSWHSKEVDTEHLVKVVEIMKSKAYVFVTFLLTSENFEQTKEAIAAFQNLGVELELRPARLTITQPELYPFTTEQLEYIKAYTQDWSKINTPAWKKKKCPSELIVDGTPVNWHKVTMDKENVYTGWKCTAGMNRFTITPAGDINKCFHNVGGTIGNVFTGYTLPTMPVTCTYQKACHCKLDAIVDKWRL